MKLFNLLSLYLLLSAYNCFGTIESFSIYQGFGKTVIVIGDFHPRLNANEELVLLQDKIDYQILVNFLFNYAQCNSLGKVKLIFEKWKKRKFIPGCKYIGCLKEFSNLRLSNTIKIGKIDLELFDPRPNIASMFTHIYEQCCDICSKVESNTLDFEQAVKFFEELLSTSQMLSNNLSEHVEELKYIIKNYKSIMSEKTVEFLNQQLTLISKLSSQESIKEHQKLVAACLNQFQANKVEGETLSKIIEFYEDILDINRSFFDLILIDYLDKDILRNNQTTIIYVGNAHACGIYQSLRAAGFKIIFEHGDISCSGKGWDPTTALPLEQVCKLLNVDKTKIVTDAKKIDLSVKNLRTNLLKVVSKSVNNEESFVQCLVCFNEAVACCSKCHKIAYCSRSCQLKHWESGHKNECTLL